MIVTIFNGSPRGKASNSHLITKPLLQGCQRAGAETHEIFLIEKNIQYCLGCFDCWGKTPGICTIKDDMAEMIRLFLKSDFVGFATPVYGLLMTGLLKNFTDRFLPLATPHIRRNEDGSFYHEGRVSKFPRQFLIANSGFPGDHNFNMLKAYYGQQNFVLEIYRNSGEILQTPLEEYPQLKEPIEEFYNALEQAGWEMVSVGEVKAETIAGIHQPLISDEDYMNEANKEWDEQLAESEKSE